jgi:hypothetical protein
MMTLFRAILRDAFRIAFVSYAVFFFADIAKPGFATNYLNLNKLLLLILFLGILHVFLTKQDG